MMCEIQYYDTSSKLYNLNILEPLKKCHNLAENGYQLSTNYSFHLNDIINN